MTLEEGTYVLSLIQYRSGWKFVLHEKGLDTYFQVSADATGQITLGSGETLTLARFCAFDIQLVSTQDCLIEIVHNEIEVLERHERHEWFKVNGVQWINPHAEGHDKTLPLMSCGGLQPIV